MVAHYDPGREALTIWSSTQNPHILRTFLAQTLGLGEDRVHAIASEVGGGFGAEINTHGEDYVAVAQSERLGLPIKWLKDRSEAFLATVHGGDLIVYVELAATRGGKVLGLRRRIIANIGAYNMLLTAGVPTHSMTMANATYPFSALRATLTGVFTNKTPPTRIGGRGGPMRPTSSRGRWTCRPTSSTWTRPSCGARTCTQARRPRLHHVSRPEYIAGTSLPKWHSRKYSSRISRSRHEPVSLRESADVHRTMGRR